MDASIGQLRLVGRVVGAARGAHRPDVVDLLTGQAARRRLFDALTSIPVGDEVVVIRSLTCRATLRWESGPEVLATSVAASTARLLRDHPADDDSVVRFADESAYVAAFIHDRLDGQPHRWYFDAFAPYRRPNGSTDWGALFAAHRDRTWRILALVRRRGDLEALLAALGEDGIGTVVREGTVDGVAGWAPLVAAAAEIVGRVGAGDLPAPPPGLTAELAEHAPPPDWRDPASLGGAVAAAAAGLLDDAGTSGPERGMLQVAAQQHTWFDHVAFAAALPSPGAAEDAMAATPGAPALSPRARRVLADLSAVIDDLHLTLDAATPDSASNFVRLLAALVDRTPQWNDDDLARALTAHVLRQWAGGLVGRQTDTGPSVGLDARAPTGSSPHAELVDDAPLDPAPSRSPQRPPSGANAGGPPTAPPGREPADPPVTGLSASSVAKRLAARFPAPRSGAGRLSASASASGLLVLRAALDLGLGPHLLHPVGVSGQPLVAALVRRWAQPAPDAPMDPLLVLLGELSSGPEPARTVEDACLLAVRRLLGQRLVAAPFRAVGVPHGPDGLATVVVDADGHALPLGSRSGRSALDASPDLAAAGLALEPEPAGAEVQASVADGLDAVVTDGTGDDDPQRALLLDLLAVSCVHVWRRWLPGFAEARAPFLLSALVRRPAELEFHASALTVRLPPRPHDVVLALAGYLEPVDAGAVLGGRRLHFTSGDGHGG
jgi:hypothetical protein